MIQCDCSIIVVSWIQLLVNKSLFLAWAGWGEGPPKFEVGTAHASVLLTFRELIAIVLLDACKSTNWLKKRCHGGIFCSEIEFFRQENGHIHYTISEYQIYRRDRQKTDKDEMRTMTKKRSSEIFDVKIEIEKSHSKIWSTKYFSSPKP